MPARCPQCGRFLSRSFVEDLAVGHQPCPRCGSVIGERDVSLPEDAPVEGVERTAPHRSPEPGAHVPPAVERDVLEGWDQPGSLAPPTVGAVWSPRYLPLVGAAAGGLLGALLLPGRRPLGATLGAVAGVGATLAAVRSRRSSP